MEPIPYNQIMFLEQSNAIESEFYAKDLVKACCAWGVFKSKDMTVDTILEAHHTLMQGKVEDKYVGKFRDCDVFVGGRKCIYVSDTLLREELQSIIDKMYEFDQITDEFAKGCHVRFEVLHPFIDGNGRIGRMIYNKHRLDFGLDIHIIFESEKHDYYRWFENTDRWLNSLN